MKQFLAILLLSSLIGCGGVGTALQPETQAPYTKFSLLEGDYLLLNALRGRNVALLFWATTCRKSKQIIEEFNEQSRELAGKNVVFVAVNLDDLDKRDEVEAMVRAEGPGNVIHAFSGNGGDDEAYMAFRGEYLPVSFLIDPAGKIVATDNSLDYGELLQ